MDEGRTIEVASNLMPFCIALAAIVAMFSALLPTLADLSEIFPPPRGYISSVCNYFLFGISITSVGKGIEILLQHGYWIALPPTLFGALSFFLAASRFAREK